MPLDARLGKKETGETINRCAPRGRWFPEVAIFSDPASRRAGEPANKAGRDASPANESLNEISSAEARGDAEIREVSIPRAAGKRRPFDTAGAAAAAAAAN